MSLHQIGALCALLWVAPALAGDVTQARAERAALAMQQGTVVSSMQATAGGKPAWVVVVEHDGTVSELVIDAVTGGKLDVPPDPPQPVETVAADDC